MAEERGENTSPTVPSVPPAVAATATPTTPGGDTLADYACLPFSAAGDPKRQFEAVPKGAGVFLLSTPAPEDRPVQFGGVEHLQARVRYYLTRPEKDRLSKRRADLRGVVGLIRFKATGSRFENRLECLRVARLVHPDDYRDVLKLSPATWLRADLSDDFPRITRTEQPFARGSGESGVGSGETTGVTCVGPFAEKTAAGAFAGALEELFELCRCRQERAGGFGHAGCATWQMGRCPLPADEPANSAEYRRRVAAAMAFAAGEDTGLAGELTAAMRSAAAELKFERAARIKARLDLAGKARTGRLESLDRAERCDFLVVMPSPAAGRWRAWAMRAGWLGWSAEFAHAEASARVSAALAWLRDAASARAAAARPAALRVEHVALLADLLARRDADPAETRETGEERGSAEARGGADSGDPAAAKARVPRGLVEKVSASSRSADVVGRLEEIHQKNRNL
jgi:hypothetical protein